MIHGVKLLRLLEQNVNAGKGVRGYREQIRELLGISEGPNGDAVIDEGARAVHPHDFSFGEVAHTFLGRDFATRMNEVRQVASLGRLYEAEGHVVMPSHFRQISAFTDTVSGLIDAMVMEAYQSPEFIADSLFTTKEARVNGGKMIGVGHDAGPGDDAASLLDSEPYPAVGLKETYVEVPDNERFGNVIQVHEKVFLYDRTDQVQSACAMAGEWPRRKKEIRQARLFLGLDNTYSRDGNASNTYLTAAGDVPNDYINGSTIVLTDWTDIDEAVQILEGNNDPLNGFEISVEPPYDVLVMPQVFANVQTIAKSTELEIRTATSTQIRRASSPLYALNVIRATRLWYNLLAAAGVSASNAKNRWHLGKFQKAFAYRQIIPFGVQPAPLSSDDVRRDIVLIKVAREHGVPYVTEPRYSGRFTEE